MEIAPQSREITTFMAKGGLFRYKRLMFGISCAPEMFQKLMEQILCGLDGCINISDDIVVFGPTKEIHDERLKAVLKRLQEFNVTLNEEKCEFCATSIEFIGHRFSAAGITPLFDKVAAVKQFRAPTTAEDWAIHTRFGNDYRAIATTHKEGNKVRMGPDATKSV